jgi:hypothetical protein
VGYLKDFIGSNTAGMYLLAGALLIGSLLVFTVPPKTANR